MVEYLVTDGYEQWQIVDTREKAQKLAIDMAECTCTDCVVNVYEINAIGQAYIPDPTPVFEWEI